LLLELDIETSTAFEEKLTQSRYQTQSHKDRPSAWLGCLRGSTEDQTRHLQLNRLIGTSNLQRLDNNLEGWRVLPSAGIEQISMDGCWHRTP